MTGYGSVAKDPKAGNSQELPARNTLITKTRKCLVSLVVILGITLNAIVGISNANAADYHQNGWTNLNWEGTVLGKNGTIEQDFSPLKIQWPSDGHQGWTYWYHIQYCWQKLSTYGNGSTCGYLGIGLYRNSSNNSYVGNFDFSYGDAIDYRIPTQIANSSTCQKRDASSNVKGTNYIVCWTGIPIDLNSRYRIRMVSDSSLGDNWWKASLTNLETNQVFEVGSIQGLGNDYSKKLAFLATNVGYNGPTAKCNEVPIGDYQVGFMKMNSEVLKYLGTNSGSCTVSSVKSSTKSGQELFLLTGSSNPSSRSYANSSNSTQTTQGDPRRTARPNSSWTRPTTLLTGLSEVRQRGYFNDNTQFFASAPEISRGRTSANSLPIWQDSLSISPSEGVSIWWGGYFIPDESGTWDFQLTSDDASFLWIGTNAVTNYSSGWSNALIALPGSHPPSVQSNSLYLEKDKVYPMRIQYGNNGGTYGTFKFEVRAPSYKTAWDTNLEGLIWSSDYSDLEDCTNFGISYTLSQKLGYGTFDVPGCKNNPAKMLSGSSLTSPTPKPTASSNAEKTRVSAPKFSAVTFSGNKMNINVNIGSSSNSRPDKVYLVAPKLGITANNPSEAKILGNTASWTITLNSLLSGESIPLEVVSEKDGVTSETLTGAYQAPSLTKIISVPLPPKSASSRVVGSSVLVVVKIQEKPGAEARTASLYSSSLGIKKSKPISGSVYGNEAVIEIPLKQSMAGKRIPVSIYLSNSKGESKPLTTNLNIPSASKSSNLPAVIPAPKPPKTSICARANQTRAFEGESCPPGWEKR
jgi:hypothetical protein